MTLERIRQIEELYHAARENRAALDHADPELRDQVESLLAHEGGIRSGVAFGPQLKPSWVRSLGL